MLVRLLFNEIFDVSIRVEDSEIRDILEFYGVNSDSYSPRQIRFIYNLFYNLILNIMMLSNASRAMTWIQMDRLKEAIIRDRERLTYILITGCMNYPREEFNVSEIVPREFFGAPDDSLREELGETDLIDYNSNDEEFDMP